MEWRRARARCAVTVRIPDACARRERARRHFANDRRRVMRIAFAIVAILATISSARALDANERCVEVGKETTRRRRWSGLTNGDASRARVG